MNECNCADLDWRGTDLTRTHHAECVSQSTLTVGGNGSEPRMYTMIIGSQVRTTSCPTCAGYNDNNQ